MPTNYEMLNFFTRGGKLGYPEKNGFNTIYMSLIRLLIV